MTTTAVATTWTADTVHSTANFAVKHSGVATFRGGFTDVTGSLDLSGEPRLMGEVDVASIPAEDENLYGHLQSPEFFDAERHPRSSSAPTDVRDGDDRHGQGRPTIKGTTQRAIATARGRARGRRPAPAHRHVEAVVDRNEFGLGWNGPAERRRPSNDVTLTVYLELVPSRGVTAMRILAIAGSLRRDSHNRRLLGAAAERCRPAPSSRCWTTPPRLPHFDEDMRGRRARARCVLRRDRRGRRLPDRDPRVQLVDPGRAQERDRLGLAAARREPDRGKAAAVIGASTAVRGRLGPGGAAQGPRPVGARVVEGELPLVHAHEQFDDLTDRSLDPDLRAALADQLAALVTEHDRELPAAA